MYYDSKLTRSMQARPLYPQNKLCSIMITKMQKLLFQETSAIYKIRCTTKKILVSNIHLMLTFNTMPFINTFRAAAILYNLSSRPRVCVNGDSGW